MRTAARSAAALAALVFLEEELTHVVVVMETKGES
jgi:hypothetical protein